jgi:superfamily I DNA and/or RNA helicase/transcription elongation GreA/GreB family factor
MSDTIKTALERMQGKLLDLSSRNRLINFDVNRKNVVRFVDAPLADIYDRLVDPAQKRGLVITGLTEPPKREWVLVNGKYQKPNELEWARSNNISISYENVLRKSGNTKRKLQTLLYPGDCSTRVRAIRNQARLVIEETGSNMLYLVFGFLEYPDKENEDRRFVAPLINVPVTLNQVVNEQQYQYSVAYTGEDIGHNMSLQEKLRIDINVALPEFDDDTMELTEYFDKLQKLFAKKEGYRVVNGIVLSAITNFTDTLLIRDIDPKQWRSGRSNKLVSHPLVKQILEGGSLDVTVEHDEDDEYDTDDDFPHVWDTSDENSTESDIEDIPLVFDADSSQLAAIDAVVNQGKSLVVSGPPGTGKSQTIANMIAALIREKKRVLFIADKMAALEVVKRRLEQVGLGAFLLSLHGSRVNKKEVLESLERRIEMKARNDRQYREEKQNQKEYRKLLRSYVEKLHSKQGASLKNSGYELIWKLERILIETDGKGAHVEIVKNASLSEEQIRQFMYQLQQIERAFNELPGYTPDSPLAQVRSFINHPSDLDEYKRRLQDAHALIDAREQSADELSRLIANASTPVSVEAIASSSEGLRHLEDVKQTHRYWDDVKYLLQSSNTAEEIVKLRDRLTSDIDSYNRYLQVKTAEFDVDQAIEADIMSGIERLERFAEMHHFHLETLADVKKALEVVDSKLQAFERVHQSLAELLQDTGLTGFAQNPYVTKLKSVIELYETLPVEQWEYQSENLLLPNCESMIGELLEERVQLDSLRKSCEARFYLDLSPDVEELQKILEVLNQDGLLNRMFNSNWSAVKARVKSILRENTDSLAVMLQAVRDLLSFKMSLRQHQSNALWSATKLGPNTTKNQLESQRSLAAWNRSVMLTADTSIINIASLIRLSVAQVKSMKRNAPEVRTLLVRSEQARTELYSASRTIARYFENRTTIEGIESLRKTLINQRNTYSYLSAHCKITSSISSIKRSIDAHHNSEKVRELNGQSTSFKSVFGPMYDGLATDIQRLDDVCSTACRILSLRLPHAVQSYALHVEDPKHISMLLTAIENDQEQSIKFNDVIEALQRFVSLRNHASKVQSGNSVVAGYRNYLAVLEQLNGYLDQLIPWHRYTMIRDTDVDESLIPLVELMEKHRTDGIPLGTLFLHSVYRTSLKKLERSASGKFLLRTNIDEDRRSYVKHDRNVISKQAREIAHRCFSQADPPDGTSGSRVDSKTDMQLIKYLIPQQRPRVPLRKLLQRAGDAIQELKPCFMMSPQAVAQYLTPQEIEFDVVLIDEASQVRPEKAIGAIARGKQLVVVGDSKQLPPTSFFEQGAYDSQDEEELAIDTTSVLTLAESHIPDHRSLLWHYRSRHESLIAFSNQHFYNEKLVVTPSPYRRSKNLGVYGVYLANGIYANSMNAAEADHCVQLALDWMLEHPDKSVGIVTLNKKQAELIQRVLDEKVVTDTKYSAYITRWEEEGQPAFVKNLENVQGDERDAIIVSTTFGPSEKNGKVMQNFGPIGKTGGERRLNVLFTRAKERLTVVTSMQPEDVTIGSTTPLGTRILREYIESIKQQQNQFEFDEDEYDIDDMIRAIRHHLSKRGYMCIPNYGTPSSKIDLVVEHPDAEGELLAAIETDGLNYSSITSSRDRDRLRGEIMDNMGWKDRVIRVWTSQWYNDRNRELDRVLTELDRIRESATVEHTSVSKWVQLGVREYREPLEQPAETNAGTDANAEINTASEAKSVETVHSAALETVETMVSEERVDTVDIGDTVQFVDVNDPETVTTFKLIKSEKDDIDAGIISIERPLGRIMYKHKVGDEVVLVLPAKKQTQRFIIVNVLKSLQ